MEIICRMQSSTAPPWYLEMASAPAATAAVMGATQDATVRAASTEGERAPASAAETSTASITRATSGDGNSPSMTSHAISVKEMRPIRSVSRYPRTVMAPGREKPMADFQ